jgi:hypothetical protein
VISKSAGPHMVVQKGGTGVMRQNEYTIRESYVIRCERLLLCGGTACGTPGWQALAGRFVLIL